MKHDEYALNTAITIHKLWHDSHQVEVAFRNLKVKCLQENWDYNLVLKRTGDYMRECFDREPKMRNVPVEQAMEGLKMWLNYMSMEM